ncbi:hypothetical protein Tco_1034345 [Tanacetum coccineum]
MFCFLHGNYGSIDEGAIWLHTDPYHGLEAFGNLYSKLRIVNPALFNDSHAENITQMLYKVGVHQLSAHEVLKVHILPAICDEKAMSESSELMYLSFVMFHLESSCPECLVGKEHILSQLRNNAFISTNHRQAWPLQGCFHIVEVEKLISDIPRTVIKNKMVDDDCISSGSIVKDYDSEELMHLLSIISSNGDGEKGKYLMEVFDKLLKPN